jgi:hypothetical protein
MPEVAISRDDLLVSVHVLERGDVLIVRCPEDTTLEEFEFVRSSLREKLEPLGVECLVTTQALDYEVVRPAKAAD